MGEKTISFYSFFYVPSSQQLKTSFTLAIYGKRHSIEMHDDL